MRANIFPVLFMLCLLSELETSAQYFGGNPSSLKWKQINTDTARVIFPAGLEEKASEIAAIVHRMAGLESNAIGKVTRKIDMVLQSHTTVSNGYVSLGPFRSELYLTPEQNSFELGSLAWHKSLAIHEYRHVHQFNNYRAGVSKIFYILFGEEGQALANSMAVPDWFWEGDAVYQETLLSRQGRGRLAYFFNPYRSIWAADKNYSWMKLRNGSYRDLVPDHYKLGYLLVQYGREKFGPAVWNRTSVDAAAFKNLFYPFQHAFRRTTNQEFREFRREALEHSRKTYGVLPGSDAASEYAATRKHFMTDMEFPQWAGKDSILYIKSSYNAIPAFYTRDPSTGKDKKLFTRDISQDNYFSYRNGKIVYSAFQRNGRRGWMDYGNLRLLDLRSGRQFRLTKRTKYFSPDISDDGNTIVAVHVEAGGNSELRLIDVHTGNTKARMPNPEGLYYTYPKFFNGDKIVTAVRNPAGRMALGIFDFRTGNAEWVIPFTNTIIAFPQVNGDTISFSMSEAGYDRLFTYFGGRVYRFEPDDPNTATGDYQPASNGQDHAWTRYTAVGQLLTYGKGKLSPVTGLPVKPFPYPINPLIDSLHIPLPVNSSADSFRINLIDDTALRDFTVKDYPESFRLFNFHSRRPYVNDPDYTFSMVGENVLNTMLSEIYATYNRNERFKEIGGSLAYGRWLPELRAGVAYTIDRSFRDSSSVVTWNELNANAGVTVPLSFINGHYFQNINIGAYINTKQIHYTGASKQTYDNRQFHSTDLRISFTNQRLRAKQHIYPRIAQAINARYRTSISNYTAYQLFAGGSVFLPGISVNHNIVLQAGYQQRDTLQQYVFSNSFPLARGYSNINLPRMWKAGINYHFPIAYPDRGIGNIVYLLRLRGNVFYDYMEAKSLRTGTRFLFRSAGCEIYFDSKWWNQLPLSFGIRYSRLIDNELPGMSSNRWEFILPVNLLSR